MSFHAFGDRTCPSTVTSLTVIEIMNDVMDENFEHAHRDQVRRSSSSISEVLRRPHTVGAIKRMDNERDRNLFPTAPGHAFMGNERHKSSSGALLSMNGLVSSRSLH